MQRAAAHFDALEKGPVHAIDISHCRLADIPSFVFDCTTVEKLDLSHNRLNFLTPQLGVLTALKTLKLEDNPLELMPADITQRSAADITSFLRQLSKKSEKWNDMKLMIVGDAAVGKTSLVRYLIPRGSRAKLDATGNTISTDGIDIADWSVTAKGRDLHFSVWDFGGQVVFYPTHQFFLSSHRCLYLIMFDMTQEDTFYRVDYWLRQVRVKDVLSPPTVILIATHFDQVTEEQARAVYKRIGECFTSIHKNICHVCFVSLKTKEGLEALQEKIVDTVLSMKVMNTLVPGSYLLLNQRIKKLAASQNTINWTTLESICLDCSLEPEDIPAAVNFMADMGTLIHFDDERYVSSMIHQEKN